MRIINQSLNLDIEYEHHTLYIKKISLFKEYALIAYNDYTKKEYTLYSSHSALKIKSIHHAIIEAYKNNDKMVIVDATNISKKDKLSNNSNTLIDTYAPITTSKDV